MKIYELEKLLDSMRDLGADNLTDVKICINEIDVRNIQDVIVSYSPGINCNPSVNVYLTCEL